MKKVAIIQARMASTRLPEKAMLLIEGKPMLWHVVRRLESCRNIDRIVVATTTNPEDQTIADFCSQENIAYYRGDSEDVLDRYYRAAKAFEADVIIRVTSDCPLIDPQVVDLTIQSLLDNFNDHIGACNILERTYPRGLDCEVFKFDILEQLWQSNLEDKYREHVTLYLYEHSEKYAIKSVEHDRDLSSYRWTVDEEKDLALVREIYHEIYPKNNIFYLEDILELLKNHPHLASINKDIQQKIY